MIFSLEGTIARPNFTSTKIKDFPSFQGEEKSEEKKGEEKSKNELGINGGEGITDTIFKSRGKQ